MATTDSRPRPVLYVGLAVAVLTAVTTYTDIENLVDETVLNWLRLVVVVLGVVATFWAQSQVTPLASPRTKEGLRLVPSQRRQAPGFIPSPPATFTTGTTGTVTRRGDVDGEPSSRSGPVGD